MKTSTPTTAQISKALMRTLEKCAEGPSAQLGPQAGGMAFAVLAGLLEERGLVRLVRHRDHTRTYALTAAGRSALAGYRLHGTGA